MVVYYADNRLYSLCMKVGEDGVFLTGVYVCVERLMLHQIGWYDSSNISNLDGLRLLSAG